MDFQRKRSASSIHSTENLFPVFDIAVAFLERHEHNKAKLLNAVHYSTTQYDRGVLSAHRSDGILQFAAQ